MPTADLCAWAESTLYDVGRGIDAYRDRGEELGLFEARQSVDFLDTILAEIVRREADEPLG